MIPSLYIDAVLRLKTQKEAYWELNNKIKALQRDNDFSSYLTPIDSYIETAFVEALDDALFELTGFKELASYYLYECSNNTGYIREISGFEYRWTNGEEFNNAISQMVKYKGKN